MNPGEINAFVPDCEIPRLSMCEGPLRGTTFGLKDMLDLAGVPTGAGNPEWRRTHNVPTRTAPVAVKLLDAGAKLVGKTVTDKLAWDTDGRNAHYGTPVNVAAPGRMPGGSSSGSAAATAAGLCDFAIGTDTGGSVRLPASFCGIYGLRPTHGRVSSVGVVPLAASFDTVGWFARDPCMMRRVSNVLLGRSPEAVSTERLLIADDLFALAASETREALASLVARLAGLAATVEHVTVAGERASSWRDAFRALQAAEAWAEHRDWIRHNDPDFGTDIREHLEEGEHLDPNEVERARTTREEVRTRMAQLVPPGTLLILPTVPGIAPRLDVMDEEHDRFSDRAHEMLCVAGHTGMPQLSMPLACVDGCPVGLSALAARDHDEALLEFATLTKEKLA